jgi:alpha-tubulin suppressor-like RCC1 family protein
VLRQLIPAVLSTLLAGGLVVGPFATAAPAASAADPAAAASTFTPLTPVRVLDTRSGGPVGAGGTVTLDLASRVPASATAVVLNVTGVTPTASTVVTVYPAGLARPTASNLNLPAGDIRANQVTVTLGTNRAVILHNLAGSIHLVADLAGYYSTGNDAKFSPLPPKRALDTRVTGGPLGPGATRVLDLTGLVPESATAVTFNLTATGATASTFVTAWPVGGSRPDASNLNLPAGDTRPNLVTVALGAGRKVNLFNLAGSVALIADVTGFYTPDYGSVFVPYNPKRVLDTRNGTGTGGTTTPVGSGDQGSLILDLANDVPATSTGVVLNITGVAATAPTHVTVWAPIGNVPNASTVNLSPGQIAPNAATVAFAFEPQVQFHNNSGSVHLVADLAGVFVRPDFPNCMTDCVYSWGLANAPMTGSLLPEQERGLSGVRAVAGGREAVYALLDDGTVRAWGNNDYGQLGNGWASSLGYGGSAVPVPVVGLTNVTAIDSRGDAAYALRSDGTVWAWGDGSRGQLGNGTTGTDASLPVQVGGLFNIVAISAGDNTGYAVGADGTVWSWGSNGGGHLGIGSNVEYSMTPVQVSGLTGITQVAGGGHSNGTYALRQDGTVWSWGYNFDGALGNGVPCVVEQQCVYWSPTQVSDLTDATAVASGVYGGMALRADGTVWTWGANYQGKLGNGAECGVGNPNGCRSYVPVKVANLTGVTQVATFYGGGYVLRGDGTVWSWGSNYRGTLGTNTIPADASSHTTVPVQVMNLSGVEKLDSGLSRGFAIVPNP